MYDKKIGVGLFKEASEHSFYLSRRAEKNILFYLTIPELILYAGVSQVWKKETIGEIKRRKQCVTIYTWPAGKLPIESYWHEGSGIRGTSGHSALRTYGNSNFEEGIYVSFYPGKCDTNNSVPSCKKSVSHFHTWDQEASKEMLETIPGHDLLGLDVDAIHIAFHDLHDGSMNSKKEWSPRYNCSDVALLLLGKGGLFEKVHYAPFGWKTISAIGIASGILGYRILFAWFDAILFRSLFNPDFKPGKRSIRREYPERYQTDRSTSIARPYTNWPEANVLGAPVSLIITCLYSFACYSKSNYPWNYYYRPCLSATLQAGVLGFVTPLAEIFLVRNVPIIKNNMIYVDRLANKLDIIINNDFMVTLGQYLLDKIMEKFEKPTDMGILPGALGYSIILFPPLIGMICYAILSNQN
jgi:hypothetical protein